ncbi:MAG: TIGR03960 family B12-binding radical SAM protein [Armatimonadota bacterium]
MKEKYFSLLKNVNQPACYIGSEFNIIKKQWDKNKFKIGLVFPDAYTIAESSLSLKILYDLFNEKDDFIAERFTSPGLDLEKQLLAENLHLLSLENFKPLKEFDVAGFTIQYELNFTNILNILNLSGIKFSSSERSEKDPIICAGGPGIFNLEPVSEVFDFIFVGEAEEIVVEIFELMRKLKSEGRKKIEILSVINEYDCIYVPGFYKFEYDDNGGIKKVENIKNSRVKKQIIKSFDNIIPPLKVVVPNTESIHNRVAIEIFRGCARGCRFCQAGMIYRPVRERSVDNILKYALESVKNTGFDEISFVSLNCADYSGIVSLILRIKEKMKNISVSLPSLRLDAFTGELARALSTGKRSSLTFAPEAGSQKLRNVINKGISEEDILKALEVAKKYGWKQVKLYFMIGLPREETADLDAIVDLVKKIIIKTGFNLSISVSSFIPKAHTPFQWRGQASMDEINEKIVYLRKRLRHGKIKFSFHDPKQSFLEGVFARGDRRLFKVVKTAFEKGCRFDGWSDHFDFDKWMEAFKENAVDPKEYNQRRIEYDRITPWDHINTGVVKRFLMDEDIKSREAEVTGDCRYEGCASCGICTEFKIKNDIKDKIDFDPVEIKITETDNKQAKFKYRVKYSKGGNLKFIGHLDTLKTIIRAVNRSFLPVAYSQGFRPRMKISASHPLGLFYTSEAEYFDIELLREVNPQDINKLLIKQFPEGFKVLDIEKVDLKTPSLMQSFKTVDYEVALKNGIIGINAAIESLLNSKNIFLERKKKQMPKDKVLNNIKYIDSNDSPKLYISLCLSNEGGCKPSDILDILGVNPDKIEQIKRVNFR